MLLEGAEHATSTGDQEPLSKPDAQIAALGRNKPPGEKVSSYALELGEYHGFPFKLALPYTYWP